MVCGQSFCIKNFALNLKAFFYYIKPDTLKTLNRFFLLFLLIIRVHYDSKVAAMCTAIYLHAKRAKSGLTLVFASIAEFFVKLNYYQAVA